MREQVREQWENSERAVSELQHYTAQMVSDTESLALLGIPTFNLFELRTKVDLRREKRREEGWDREGDVIVALYRSNGHIADSLAPEQIKLPQSSKPAKH